MDEWRANLISHHAYYVQSVNIYINFYAFIQTQIISHVIQWAFLHQTDIFNIFVFISNKGGFLLTLTTKINFIFVRICVCVCMQMLKEISQKFAQSRRALMASSSIIKSIFVQHLYIMDGGGHHRKAITRVRAFNLVWPSSPSLSLFFITITQRTSIKQKTDWK